MSHLKQFYFSNRLSDIKHLQYKTKNSEIISGFFKKIIINIINNPATNGRGIKRKLF